MNIYLSYTWKLNSNQIKQVNSYMAPIEEGWHYFAVKKLSALLQGITSKHDGDLYCFHCLNCLRLEQKTN